MNARITDTTISDREISLTRVFDAPRELVFAAFLDPQHISNWWGPDGFRTTTHEMDVRPGGVWRYTMHGPDGSDYANLVKYTEVVHPERIAYDHGGDPAEADFHATISFEDLAGKTRVTLHSLFASAEQRQAAAKFGAIEGGQQTLARLADQLAGQSEDSLDDLVLVRVFAAPRELVWKTTLTLRGAPINATAAERQVFRAGHQSMQSGFGGTFAQLTAYLEKLPR